MALVIKQGKSSANRDNLVTVVRGGNYYWDPTRPEAQGQGGSTEAEQPVFSQGLAEREWGFPGGPVVKNLPANAGDVGLIPGSGRSPGGGNGYPFQYSCLGNLMDRGVWWVAVHEVAKSQTGLSE